LAQDSFPDDDGPDDLWIREDSDDEDVLSLPPIPAAAASSSSLAAASASASAKLRKEKVKSKGNLSNGPLDKLWRGFRSVAPDLEAEIKWWAKSDPVADSKLPVRWYQKEAAERFVEIAQNQTPTKSRTSATTTDAAAAAGGAQGLQRVQGGVKGASNNGVFLVVHPMGSGKTETGVLGAELSLKALFAAGVYDRRVLVVGPAGLLGHFYKALIKRGLTHEHIERYYGFHSFEDATCNYKRFSENCTGNIVIIDECHRLRTTITLSSGRKRVARKNAWRVVTAAGEARADSASDDDDDDDDFEQDEHANKRRKAVDTRSPQVSGHLSGQVTGEKTKKKKKNKVEVLWRGQNVKSGKHPAHVLTALSSADSVLALTGTLFVNDLSDICNMAFLFERDNFYKSPLKPARLKKALTLSEDPDDLLYLDRLFTDRVSYLPLDQVNADMPTTKEINVLIEMSPDYYRKYVKIERAIEAQQEGSTNEWEQLETLCEPGPFFCGLRQVVDEMLGQDSAKRQFVLQLLSDGQWPMIICTNYKARGVAPLTADLEKHGFTFAVIDGDVSLKNRMLAQEKFVSGLVQVILLTQAGSTGYDLKTKVHVNLESAFNPATKNQGSSRGVRIGSGLAVTIYNLLLVKPHELDITENKMKEQIANSTPGAPNDILVIPASSLSLTHNFV